MSASLVGSEMCIRDRSPSMGPNGPERDDGHRAGQGAHHGARRCLPAAHRPHDGAAAASAAALAGRERLVVLWTWSLDVDRWVDRQK
eukprot:3675817-Alexandrium_andersonii.AAC.1